MLHLILICRAFRFFFMFFYVLKTSLAARVRGRGQGWGGRERGGGFARCGLTLHASEVERQRER